MEYVSRLRAFNSLGCSNGLKKLGARRSFGWNLEGASPQRASGMDELGSNLGDLFMRPQAAGGPKKSAWYARYT